MAETMGQYAARLERENKRQAYQIARAVQQLDDLIAGLRGQGRALSEWREDAEHIQRGLRA